MISPELENLAHRGVLKREPPARAEYEGLVASAAARRADAARPDLSLESRFDLAYNAAHALALAALRRMGYRSDSRYAVFQVLPYTAGLPTATWRFLAKCHERRNLAEYEGARSLDGRLIDDLVCAAEELMKAVSALRPPGG